MPDSLPPEDEIARLRVENEQLRAERDKAWELYDDAERSVEFWTAKFHAAAAALGPFALSARKADPGWSDEAGIGAGLNFGHLRTALRVVTGQEAIPHPLHTHPNPKREGEDHA